MAIASFWFNNFLRYATESSSKPIDLIARGNSMMNGGFELLYKVLIYKMVHSDLDIVQNIWKLIKMDKISSD